MYRFIQGRACTSADLTREPVWRGVARRLGEWHAVVPVASVPRAAVEERGGDKNVSLSKERAVKMPSAAAMNAITPGKVTPNTWTVMQRWIFALPTTTPAEAARKQVLQTELERTVRELGHTPGLGEDGVQAPPHMHPRPVASDEG
jgi:ethanolamine kinase